MNANLLTLTKEKRELPMKRPLMTATALSAMKKMAFTILCCTLLMLFAAPAWAQCSGDEPPPDCVAEGTFTNLQPGVTVVLPVGKNEYRFEPLNPLGGEKLRIRAFKVLRSDFDFVPTDPETCVPVSDFTAAAGAQTCMEFQHDCSKGTASLDDCATFLYKVKWIYDLPPAVPALGGPGWRIIHGEPCDGQIASDFATRGESIFAFYSVKKFDPVHGGGGAGPSCNAPEWDPSAPLITTGATGFVGFEPPVSNSEFNRIKAGRTVPLKWLQLDSFGTPVTNLHLCTDQLGCTMLPWVRLESTPIVCPGSIAPVTAGLTLLTGTFNNQGKGRYHFNWNTDPGSMGCVAVVLTFDTGVVASANFIFK